MGPTREGRKWAQPAWWHSSSLGRYLTEEWRLPQERVPACMVDARHWLAVKVAQQDNVFKDRRLYRKRYTDSIKKERLFSLYFFDNHFLFKCNEPCKHLSCFVSLFFAISLNFNCLTFVIIFVQFCNFYFCTLGQINECVHSCVTFYFMITYQVER